MLLATSSRTATESLVNKLRGVMDQGSRVELRGPFPTGFVKRFCCRAAHFEAIGEKGR